MDSNSPAPSPAPVQAPTPNGQPPKKLGTGAIIAIAGGAVFLILLIIGIVVAVSAMTAKDKTDTSRNDDSSKTDTPKDEDSTASAITAKTLVDLRAVCIGDSVQNAAPLAKPYRYVIYENNNIYSHNPELRKQSLDQPFKDEYAWDMFGVATNDESVSLSNKSDPSELNVVVCLDRDDSTAVKTMTCAAQLSPSQRREGAPSTIDFHSVKYKVSLYEAQTGKKIKDLAAINGPATECPSIVYYTPGSPGIYGDPDTTKLNAALEAFEK